MKNIVKRVLIGLVGVVIVGVIGTGIMFREELSIAGSIKHVKTKLPVYTMEIKGDYHFDEFLKAGGASSDKEVAAFLTKYISHGFYQVQAENKGAGCSTLSAKNREGSHMWGRNFDWTDSVAIIVKSKPERGYASLSTCEFGNVTGNSKTLPEDMKNKMLAIAALYVPMDGINEKGLCVADLEVNEGGMIEKDTPKPDLTITTAIRLMLNQAATVEEAIDLIEQYDIHASGNISHHLAISDATGRSVVIEFIKGEAVVVESPYVTNFNLANGYRAAGGKNAQERFETLESIYKQKNGQLSADDMKEALEAAAQKEGKWKTQWSIVYDSSNRSADYYFLSQFGKPISFKVGE